MGSHSRMRFDHTTNHRHGRHPRMVYRRGIPGHSPRFISTASMLWINAIKDIKILFGQCPCIGGGEGMLFNISRSRHVKTRYRAVRKGHFIGWWATRRPEMRR